MNTWSLAFAFASSGSKAATRIVEIPWSGVTQSVAVPSIILRSLGVRLRERSVQIAVRLSVSLPNCGDVVRTSWMYRERFHVPLRKLLVQRNTVQNVPRLALTIGRERSVREVQRDLHVRGKIHWRLLLCWHRLAFEVVIMETDRREPIAQTGHIDNSRRSRAGGFV